jgi:hypothetical protein
MTEKQVLRFILALLAIVIATALIVYGVNGLSESTPSFFTVFSLILGAVFGLLGAGGGVFAFLKLQAKATGLQVASEEDTTRENKSRHRQPKIAITPQENGKDEVEPNGELKSWFTRNLLIQLDFDACHPRHIENTLKEIQAPFEVNSKHQLLLDSVVEYVTSDVTGADPLLLFVNRVYFFEPRKIRTKAWDKFTKLICRAYRNDKAFRQMVKSRTHLSADFPIEDLLNCR